MRKEEIFICKQKNFKKIKRFIEINIDNNQAILVLSIIDLRKRIKKKSYISVCDNKISGYTLFNKNNLNVNTNDEMGYIGVNRLIKSEVLYCLLQKIIKQRLKRDKYSKNIKGLGGFRTAFLSKLPCYF